jgi:sterol desaturase/sphingolipid hydroxylase (fatty acid hydroxylase superfamily)
MTNGLTTVAAIMVAMAFIALIETAVPLHPRDRRNRVHLGPNLVLTFITFATNLAFNAAVVAGLIRIQDGHFGLLQWWSLPPLATVAIVVLGLDFAFYVAHVAMHASPGLWRFHCVHHSDLAVDVTTTIRQHPGEGVIRYAFMGTFAVALGAPPGAFAVYRVWSALNGLAEHANIRVPRGLDEPLSLLLATPNMHKLHHSRAKHETNSNYGNIFSLFDRLFQTFRPSEHGVNVVYGLADLDDLPKQSTRALLALPFRRGLAPAGTSASAIQTIAR